MSEGEKDNSSDPERDRQGRWRKGASGNPKGRPRKQPRFDASDSYIFGHTLVNIEVNGHPRRLLRKELNREKLFQTAMKGDVRAQIYCDKIMREGDEIFARANLRHQELTLWIVRNKPERIPIEIELEIASLERILRINDQTGGTLK